MKYINALNNKNNYYEEAEFKSKAKEIKKEYKVLMQQRDKEAKEEAKIQKLREKEEKLNNLRNVAKNKAKRALDKASEFLSTEEEETEWSVSA
ncbi:MAG: hypothetical protein J1G30_04715 [Spirochaetales bacterium]|nr:hypothetical protein [Spirochaetales bacterium]